MSNLVITIPVKVSFNPKAYMIRDKIIAKMCEMEIKDFSDDELRRAFKDCVAQNRLFACAKELIESEMLSMNDVYILQEQR